MRERGYTSSTPAESLTPPPHGPAPGSLCRCANVYLGNKIVGKSWNPDCPTHPWNERLQKQANRAVELQLLAREARRKAKEDNDK